MEQQQNFGDPGMAGPKVDHGPGAPLIGALVGAAVGAGIWALIAGLTGYEVGYVAWAVGGFVGFGATKLGGRGAGLAMLCAALTLGAIFVGKMGAAQMSLSSEIDELVEEECTHEAYDAAIAEANALPVDGSDLAVREFMVDHEYTLAGHIDEISEEELAEFRESVMPEIQTWIAAPPAFEEWRDDQRALYEMFAESLSPTDMVVENLGLMDIVFAGLGVMTAFKMVAGSDSPAPRRGRNASRIEAPRKEEDGPPVS